MSEPFFNTFYFIILLSTHLFCMDVFQEGLNEVVKDDFFFDYPIPSGIYQHCFLQPCGH